MQKLEDEAKDRMARKTPINVPLPPAFTASNGLVGVNLHLILPLSKSKRKAAPSAIERSFNMASKDQLHSLIARMFYSSGLPFHLARNPYYVNLVLILQIIYNLNICLLDIIC